MGRFWEVLLRRCIAAKLPLIAAGCRGGGKIRAGVFFGGIRGMALGMERVSAFGGVEWWFS